MTKLLASLLVSSVLLFDVQLQPPTLAPGRLNRRQQDSGAFSFANGNQNTYRRFVNGTLRMMFSGWWRFLGCCWVGVFVIPIYI
ncbi:hypothetical protein BJY04DRAFT_177490 [Aspergillus karnatakaensis]|uniref:uncharacterized protein n=1 Tax=Aspergillus karnatakaensis TaxID=1810916 RepID=UPI003CCD25CB